MRTWAEKLVTSALALGTAARLTRLITSDVFPPVAAARDKVAERFGDEHPVTYLVQCNWCTGFWVSAAVTASAYRWGDRRWWRFIASVFSLSMVAPVVVEKTGT